MLKGIVSWLGEKAGEARKVQPGALSLEPLEPRVLLSADLVHVQPIPSDDTIPVDPAVRPVGLELAGSLFNYYVGDQTNWRQNVPAYAIVVYEGLYHGINLRVQGLRSHLKYEFYVASGADYRQIAVRYEGIEGLALTEDGSLEVNLGIGRGVIRDGAPYIYQEIDGQRVQVAGRFILLDDRTYSFEVTGLIDPDHALVIDPDLIWSTSLVHVSPFWRAYFVRVTAIFVAALGPSGAGIAARKPLAPPISRRD